MSSIRIENEAFGDIRFERLARECGLADADHARGKMARLWRQCTAEKCYALAIEDVQSVLGENAAAGLVAARLGEVIGDKIRIKGTKGRIEWLDKLRKNGKFGKMGGRPSKVTKQNPTGYPDGFHDETPSVIASASVLSLVPSPTQKKNKSAFEGSPDEQAVVVRVLGKITSRTKVEYRPKGENARLIVARLRDGVTETELRAVIAYCWSASGLNWEGKPDMHVYLRPSTLFGPSKIEQYLDPARSWVKRHFPEEQAS